MEFCDGLYKRDDVIVNHDYKCWLYDFKNYTINVRKKDFPIEDPKTFENELWTWVTTTAKGIQAKSDYTLGFIDTKLKFFKIHAVSVGAVRDPSSKK